MRFLLSFMMDPASPPGAELNDKCFEEMMTFVSELTKSGRLLFDSQIMPQPSVVQFRAVGASIEEIHPSSSLMLGGFFVISATTEAEARALVRRCPHLQVGPVELRLLNETEENAYRP